MYDFYNQITHVHLLTLGEDTRRLAGYVYYTILLPIGGQKLAGTLATDFALMLGRRLGTQMMSFLALIALLLLDTRSFMGPLPNDGSAISSIKSI